MLWKNHGRASAMLSAVFIWPAALACKLGFGDLRLSHMGTTYNKVCV